MSIHIVAPGTLTSVQDLGRFGHTHIGVGHAGAMDTVALRLANLLVGNDENAAALEITLRGPTLRFDDDAIIAITGGEGDARDENGIVPRWRPFLVRAGCAVNIGHLRSGSRAYVAVAGGFDVTPVLGSRSTDVNACLGPFGGRALVAGDVLPTTCPSIVPTAHGTWSLDPSPWFEDHADRPIALIRGAHFGTSGRPIATVIVRTRIPDRQSIEPRRLSIARSRTAPARATGIDFGRRRARHSAIAARRRTHRVDGAKRRRRVAIRASAMSPPSTCRDLRSGARDKRFASWRCRPTRHKRGIFAANANSSRCANRSSND